MPSPNILQTKHNAGFFSCCTIRLINIIDYFDKYHHLPPIVDSSKQFSMYKKSPNKDLSSCLFENGKKLPSFGNQKKINIINGLDNVHFPNYQHVNYKDITPFVKKYYTPSSMIMERVSKLEAKYKLDYQNTCLVYYRGNDKCTELRCPNYQTMVNKAILFKKTHPNVKFVVQSDEQEFLDYFIKIFPNAVYFTEIKPIKKAIVNPVTTLSLDEKEEHAYNFLAIIYYLSRMKYIITTTHNAAFWLCLYRGSCDNVYQYFRPSYPMATKPCPEKGYWYT